MKELEKISINPEKVIKDDELVNLRGGEYEDLAVVYCWSNSDYSGCFNRPYCNGSQEQYVAQCRINYPDTAFANCEDSGPCSTGWG